MKYCSHCGKEIMDDAVICIHCGCSVYVGNKAGVPDAPNTGWLVLGFLFPLVGLIMYLANKDTTPLRAKSAGKGALITVILWLVMVVYTVIMLLISVH